MTVSKRTQGWLVLCVALLVTLTAGCGPGRPPYTANEKLVATLGEDAAKEKLKKLLSQAAAPQVTGATVEVAHDYYFYQAIDLAMFGRGFVSQKVFFAQVQQVEVWEDGGRHYCKLIGEDKLDQLRWTTAAEAREFADLVMSFKANLSAPAQPKPDTAPTAVPTSAPSATPDAGSGPPPP